MLTLFGACSERPYASDAGPAPQPDGSIVTCALSEGGALAPSFAGQAARAGDISTDLRCFTTGGTAPFRCEILVEPGSGSLPAGMEVDVDEEGGCILSGDTSAAVPGLYGALARVIDANDESVELPLFFEIGDCTTAEVAIEPASKELLIHRAGAAQTWTVTSDDIDAIEDAGECRACAAFSLLTRAPLGIALNLDCGAEGALCSDCDGCVQGDSCPGSHTLSREIELREHEAARSGPAWTTMEVGVSYSGSSLDPCGGKSWQCHIDVLELP